jgi:hypothetical protein
MDVTGVETTYMNQVVYSKHLNVQLYFKEFLRWTGKKDLDVVKLSKARLPPSATPSDSQLFNITDVTTSTRVAGSNALQDTFTTSATPANYNMTYSDAANLFPNVADISPGSFLHEAFSTLTSATTATAGLSLLAIDFFSALSKNELPPTNPQDDVLPKGKKESVSQRRLFDFKGIFTLEIGKNSAETIVPAAGLKKFNLATKTIPLIIASAVSPSSELIVDAIYNCDFNSVNGTVDLAFPVNVDRPIRVIVFPPDTQIRLQSSRIFAEPILMEAPISAYTHFDVAQGSFAKAAEAAAISYLDKIGTGDQLGGATQDRTYWTYNILRKMFRDYSTLQTTLLDYGVSFKYTTSGGVTVNHSTLLSPDAYFLNGSGFDVTDFQYAIKFTALALLLSTL